MSVEPIGVLTLIIGILCLLRGQGATVIAFSIFPVLGGAAALIFGSTGIQPAHLFIVFMMISVMWLHGGIQPMVDAILRSSPAMWLALLVVYGIVTGYFAPRLLANTMDIVPIGTGGMPNPEGIIPLGPVSGNFTQAVYLLADLVTFCLILSVASRPRGFRHVTIGLMGFAAANIFFGVADMVSPGTPLVSLFSYIRNASYTFHVDEIVAGMRRIIGSWPEASAFAGASLGMVGFCGSLWICGRYSKISGLLFLVSCLMIVRSTSSSGIAGLPVCLAILYVSSIFRAGGASGTRASALVVASLPVAALAVGFLLALNENFYATVYNFIDITLLSKPTSLSAIERGTWNAYGIANFFGSYGFGVGLGTARTSSFAIALLSNVGIPGTFFFLMFLATSIVLPKGVPRSFEDDVGIAARNGCLCLLVGALISGSTVDLGLVFFIMAGLKGALAVRGRIPQTVAA
ncbi:hypothetical protein J2045_000518 [Peteryoungia aggregata LMG 23059]|uniref:Uncharacterized protein n=1 Tax=Peteryoungia aggregata LMG 23059 TaxID=1368425 RepID=A0ABU0G2F0_9HYPH|nr:hypothetical protein [Peteryoungia aggregata]MDQ0419508.1 hypothetical protein [Peteryoungia aggregata LMG 23059]